MVKDVDKLFAESIRIVKALYDDGYLKKPEGWTFTPDLLQFYEAMAMSPTSRINRKLTARSDFE